MFDDNQGITQIPESLEGGQELIIISLMKTDGGLIQNISNANQARSNLGCQTNPLALASGQSCCRTGEGQVFQPDIRQELHTSLYLLQNGMSDQFLLLRNLEILKPGQNFTNRHLRKLENILPAEGYCQRGRLQTLTMAGCTRRSYHVLLVLSLHHVGRRLTITPMHIGDQSIEANHVGTLAPLTLVMNRNFAVKSIIYKHSSDIFRQRFIRLIQREAVSL